LTAKADTISFLTDDSSINILDYGYRFGLLQQSVHFLRLKANYLTDMLAQFLNQVPTGEWPTHAVCTHIQSSSITLANTFTFEMDGASSEETTESSLLDRISTIAQSLALSSTISDDMDLEQQISACTHHQQAIVDARNLLYSMFETFGAASVEDDNPVFERLMSFLIIKLAPTTLLWIVLLMSFGMDQMESDIKTTALDKIKSVKDLKNMMLVQNAKGLVRGYSVTGAIKEKRWVDMRKILECKYGEAMKKKFVAMLAAGDKVLDDGEEALVEKKEKKGKGKPKTADKRTDLVRLEAFSRQKVHWSWIRDR
jgi:hypothetical protein